MSLDFTPSAEQETIVHAIKKNNVLVDAIAGSAKSSTCLLIAKKYPHKNILLLTYSQKLKEETRKRIVLNGIENMESHSFHSFANKYYKPCPNDIPMYEIIDTGQKPKKEFAFSIICVDEVQDMTELLYKFVYKLYYDNKKTAKLCILGDRNQCIYKFNQADERYIILAEQVFGFNDLNWRNCTLSTSFRINKETTEAVNNTMLNQDRLHAVKSGAKPRYYCANLFCRDKNENEIFLRIKELLRLRPQQTKVYEDIFVLAYSVKQASHSTNDNKRPVSILANMLVLDNIPVYVPTTDDQKIDIKILQGKIPFLTFHQAKGLEAKHVIIVGFDNFYTDKILRCGNECPNELYVAVTRHTETLSVFQNATSSPPNFMNTSLISTYWDVYNFRQGPKVVTTDNTRNTHFITELLEYTRQDVMTKCVKMLTIKKLRPAKEYIGIETVVEQRWGYEDISGLLGVVIPAYFEQLLKSKTTIHEYIKEISKGESLEAELSGEDIKSLRLEKVLDLQPTKIKDIIKIAIKWYCISTGFIVKNNQIVNLGFINSEQMAKCLENLGLLKISKQAKFEVRAVREIGEKKLIGRIDCLDGENLYEFKCVGELRNEHILQTALYMWLFHNEKKGFLFNILSSELIEISCPDTVLRDMVVLLLDAKFKRNWITTDDQFLNEIYKFKKYVDKCEIEPVETVVKQVENEEEENEECVESNILGDDFGRPSSIY